MAEMVKKATRESFGETLAALAETNPHIVVLDADLAEATKTVIFQKKFPQNFTFQKKKSEENFFRWGNLCDRPVWMCLQKNGWNRKRNIGFPG